MIYANAETAQDIANCLRGEGEIAKKMVAEKVADRLLGKKSKDGIVVMAPRQSGKTTELLLYAEEKFPGSQYCVVSINYEVQRQIIRKHWEIFTAKNLAKRLRGQEIEGSDVNPPLMLTPDALHLNKGRNLPIFVDEWGSLGIEEREEILKTGLFRAAVTS